MLRQALLGVFFMVLSCVSLIFAADENLTITTYYPSPMGSYHELSTNYLDYGTGLATQPVLGANCTEEGQTAYNNTAKKVYLCDGSKWKEMGGGTDIASLSENGYTKLTSGLIIQWGKVSPTTHATEHSFGLITYPVEFPNQVFAVTATILTKEDEGWTDGATAVRDITKTGFTLYQTSEIFDTDITGSFWIAIGY
jgi:hypothetical protein